MERKGGRGFTKTLQISTSARSPRRTPTVINHDVAVYPWYNQSRWHVTFVTFHQKMHNFSLWERHKANLNQLVHKTRFKTLKTVKVIIHEKETENITDKTRGTQRDVNTKWNVVFRGWKVKTIGLQWRMRGAWWPTVAELGGLRQGDHKC